MWRGCRPIDMNDSYLMQTIAQRSPYIFIRGAYIIKSVALGGADVFVIITVIDVTRSQ